MIRKTVIVALASLSAVALTGCGVGEAKVTEIEELPSATALPVLTSLPERADIFALYETTSTLDSDADAPVAAKVAGEVLEILVEEGDLVKEGDILARLDGELLKLEMLQARANLDKLNGEYKRLAGLHEKGLISSAMYEGMEFDIEALEASYELKELSYSYTSIRAPISGVVSSREIKVGQHVMINEPTFRITDTSRLVAHLKIPQNELPKFAAGQTLKLYVDAMPEVLFEAKISRISPTIEVATGTFRATAYIENSARDLAPGMFGRFKIAYEKHENALIIPAAAVIREDNTATVYVVADGEATRRQVKIGIETDGMIEVLGGLGIDEIVVVSGQAGLSDGSQVMANAAETSNFSG